MPSQKFGVERPHSATHVGGVVPGRALASTAETMPAGMPISERDDDRHRRELERHRQLLQRSARAPAPGCAATRRDRPCSTPPIQYEVLHAAAARRGGTCSRRSARSRCGSRSSPARISAGSPGSSCCSAEDQHRDEDQRRDRSAAMRLREERSASASLATRRRRHAARRSRRSGFSLTPVHAHQAVGHLRVAARACSLCAHRPVAVVEVDDRPLLSGRFARPARRSPCARPDRDVVRASSSSSSTSGLQ